MESDKSRSYLMSLLALLISVGIFLAFGEVVTRILKLDESTRLVMINPEGILDFKGLHQISDDPQRVYELRPGARLELDSGSRHALYAINSLGFRDEEFPEEKPEGVFRILMLGDSMTFGPAMNLGQTYPKVLEELLNESAEAGLRFQVINAGVSGYNTYQELATWCNVGVALDPDLVIVGFCVNDVDDPRRHVDAHTLETLGGLPEEMIPNPGGVGGEDTLSSTLQESPGEEARGRLPIPFKGFLREHSAFYCFLVRRYDALLKTLGIRDPIQGELRQQYQEMDAKLASYDTVEWQWLAKQWDDFESLSEKTGVPWAVVLLPWQYQLQRSGPPVPEERLSDYAHERGTFYVDPRPVLSEAKVSGLFVDMAHFSEEGHRLVAESLYQALRGSDLLVSP